MYYRFRKPLEEPLPKGDYVSKIEEVHININDNGVAFYEAILSQPKLWRVIKVTNRSKYYWQRRRIIE